MAAQTEIDDLEYHVTFPAPAPGGNDSEYYNVVESMLKNRETAVMMIGWMNCQDQYLAKYSKIYEDMGYK